MAERLSLTLNPRTVFRKKLKRLRRDGIVPVHLYGPGIEPKSLQCEARPLIRTLARAGGTTPVTITVEGEQEEHLAFVREVQWDPVVGALFHVDFLRALATQLVTADVPIILEGASPGARQVSGSVVQILRFVTIEALPLDMPRNFTVDLAILSEPDSVIRAGDITLPPDTTILTALDALVARIEVVHVEEAIGPESEAAPEAPTEEE